MIRSRRPRSTEVGVRPADFLRDAVAGLRSHRTRTWSSVLITAIGVATAIGVLGIGETGRSQIDSTFDRYRATTIRVESNQGDVLTAASIEGLRRVEAVRAAVLLRSTPSLPIVARPGMGVPSRAQVFEVAFGPLATLDLSGLAPAIAALPPGAALVGSGLAATLEIDRNAIGTGLWIDGVPHSIAGITGGSARLDGLQGGVVVGAGGLHRVGATAEKEVAIAAVRLGSAQPVGAVAAAAALPTAPGRVTAIVPPEPKRLQSAISSDVRLLTLGAAALMTLLGVIAIASSVALSVLERTAELGLRRVLGASRRHLAALVVAESALTGLVGGAIGSVVGILSVTAYAAWNRWSPSYDPQLACAAPVVGLTVGVLAGLAPAFRASRIEPGEALRHGA